MVEKFIQAFNAITTIGKPSLIEKFETEDI